jgi:hypothetical protein
LFSGSKLGLKLSGMVPAPMGTVSIVYTAGTAWAAASGALATYNFNVQMTPSIPSTKFAFVEGAMVGFNKGKKTFTLDLSKSKWQFGISPAAMAGTITSSGAPVPLEGFTATVAWSPAFKFTATAKLADAKTVV